MTLLKEMLFIHYEPKHVVFVTILLANHYIIAGKTLYFKKRLSREIFLVKVYRSFSVKDSGCYQLEQFELLLFSLL